MYKVCLNKLKYFATHGLYKHESTVGANFEVDLEVYSNLELKQQNSIKDLIDYVVLKDIVDSYMTLRYELLEDVIFDIAKDIKSKYPDVKGQLGIKKMNPALGTRCHSSEVIYTF